MHRHARVAQMIGACFCLAGLYLAAAAQAGGTKSDSEVKVTAAASKPDASRKQIVTVTMVHNDGWHTYANPVGNDDLKSNQTTVTIKGKAKPASVKVDFPTGRVHKDKDAGDYNVYEGTVEIKATVVRAEGDDGPLEVSVRITACSDRKGVCLLPATVKLTLKE